MTPRTQRVAGNITDGNMPSLPIKEEVFGAAGALPYRQKRLMEEELTVERKKVARGVGHEEKFRLTSESCPRRRKPASPYWKIYRLVEGIDFSWVGRDVLDRGMYVIDGQTNGRSCSKHLIFRGLEGFFTIFHVNFRWMYLIFRVLGKIPAPRRQIVRRKNCEFRFFGGRFCGFKGDLESGRKRGMEMEVKNFRALCAFKIQSHEISVETYPAVVGWLRGLPKSLVCLTESPKCLSCSCPSDAIYRVKNSLFIL